VNVRTAHVPPHSIEAEMSTLGSMMLDQHAIEKVAEILRPDDFYREAHRILYEVILSLAERHIPVDLLTVQEELRRRDQLEEIGGLPALVQIVESVPTASNAEYYARIVEEKAILRRLIRAAHDILQLADDPELELQDVIDRAEQAISAWHSDGWDAISAPSTACCSKRWSISSGCNFQVGGFWAFRPTSLPWITKPLGYSPLS
jgi:replicative DNA helicase